MKRNNKNNTTFIVKENTDLLHFLADKMGGMTKTSMKSLLSHKRFLLNDIVLNRLDTTLHPNDQLVILAYNNTPSFSHPMLDIIYEDGDFLVVNKHVGLLAVETHKQSSEITAFSILKSYVRQADTHNNLYIVHRIDKETSGVLLFTKNKKLQEALRHNWSKLVLKKEYVAVVHGQMPKKAETVVTWLTESDKTQRVTSSSYDNGGKKSVMHYTVRSSKTINSQTYSSLIITLETGRTNQIRTQLASMEHPIIGDKKYGKASSQNLMQRMALHAHILEIVHPFNQIRFCWEAPLPKKFEMF